MMDRVDVFVFQCDLRFTGISDPERVREQTAAALAEVPVLLPVPGQDTVQVFAIEQLVGATFALHEVSALQAAKMLAWCADTVARAAGLPHASVGQLAVTALGPAPRPAA